MAKRNILGQDYDDLFTLFGTSIGDTDLSTFSGTTISDNPSVKTALQELETALEAITEVSIANDGDNRVITAVGDSTFNAESNFLFDGSTATITGKLATTEAGTTYLSVENTSAANSQASAYIFGGTSAGNSNIVWRTGSHLNLGHAASIGGAITNVVEIEDNNNVTINDGNLILAQSGADTNPTITIESESGSINYELNLQNTTDAIGKLQKRTGAGPGYIYIQPLINDGISNGFIRLFKDTNTTANVDLEIYKGNGTSTKAFTFSADTGVATFSDYGSGTITGTATKFLAVDATGKVIEEDAPSGFTVTNESDNRVITSSGTGTGNAEATFTYTGTVLEVTDGTDTVFEIDTAGTGSPLLVKNTSGITLLDSADTYTRLRNYKLNHDQIVGSAQDGQALVYNHSTGEIELGVAGPNVVYNTADQVITSSTTLTNATGLVFALEANTTYYITGALYTLCHITPDWKHTFTAPSGSTGQWHMLHMIDTGTEDAAGNSFGSTDLFTGGGNGCFIPNVFITTSSTPGNLQYQFAQNLSTTTSITLYAESTLVLYKLS